MSLLRDELYFFLQRRIKLQQYHCVKLQYCLRSRDIRIAFINICRVSARRSPWRI